MAKRTKPAPFDGLVIVDKQTGWTSHDVVGKLRRIVGTRRVGHAGTLDPMATGVLVCGIGKATKLLGFVSGADKTYDTTIRLGISTTTDDAEGELVDCRDAAGLADDDFAHVRSAIEGLTGDILQRPSAVSAIKVNGVRAYKRVRDGEDVVLPERRVNVAAFDVFNANVVQVDSITGSATVVDLDATITCSTGTYIRALARDLGEELGVGGHLTMLRRTRVGVFRIDQAHTLDALEREMSWLPLGEVCDALFPTLQLDAFAAAAFQNGRRTQWPSGRSSSDVSAVIDPAGRLLGLAEERSGEIASLVVWCPASEESDDSGKI